MPGTSHRSNPSMFALWNTYGYNNNTTTAHLSRTNPYWGTPKRLLTYDVETVNVLIEDPHALKVDMFCAVPNVKYLKLTGVVNVSKGELAKLLYYCPKLETLTCTQYDERLNGFKITTYTLPNTKPSVSYETRDLTLLNFW